MMSEAKKKMLMKEARMQTEALMRLAVWRRAALSLMALGVLLGYWSIAIHHNTVAGIIGVLAAMIAGGVAFLISVGRKNGKKNVEKILKAVED